jgi:peptidoglycan/LPS O-acetylase OafA/YrhL
MFSAFTFIESEELASIVWDVSAIFLAWSCSLATIGFAKRYLNKNTAFRKYANETIYPFYLLHQPVIVVLASIVTTWQIPDLVKAMIIMFSSFIISVSIYRLLIYRINYLRVIFGMKPLIKEKGETASIRTGIIPVNMRKSA